MRPGEQQLTQVVKLLQDRLSPSGIIPIKNQQVRKAPEDGCHMKAAIWTQDRPTISVWYDKWLDTEDRHFWFGFEGSKAQIRTLYDDITSKSVFVPIIYTNSGFKNSTKQSTVEIVRGHNGFVYENYGAPPNYLGVYDVGLRFTSERELVAEAAKFILRVINRLGDSDEADLPPNATVEERRKYRIHKQIERNPAAASLAKEFHGTVCQVCGFDFKSVYGKIGTGFIEAHHLRPIAQLPKGEVVSYNVKKDFSVLCSNCHSMIHKRGNPADLEGLRRIVSAHKKA